MVILIGGKCRALRARRFLITKEDIRLVLERLATVVECNPPMENLRASIRRISDDVSSNNMNNLLNFVVNQIFFFYAIGKESTACILFKYFRKMGIEVDESVFGIIRQKFAYLFIPIEQYRVSINRHVREMLIEFARKAKRISQEIVGFLVYAVRNVDGDRAIYIKHFEPITIINPNSAYVDVRANIEYLKKSAGKYRKKELILLHSHPYGYTQPSYPDIWNGLMKYMLPMGILAFKKSYVFLSLVFFRSKKTVKVGGIKTTI